MLCRDNLQRNVEINMPFCEVGEGLEMGFQV